MMNAVLISSDFLKGVVGNGTAMRYLRQGPPIWSRRQSLKARRQSTIHAKHHKAFDRLSGPQAKNECLREMPAHSEQNGSLAIPALCFQYSPAATRTKSTPRIVQSQRLNDEALAYFTLAPCRNSWIARLTPTGFAKTAEPATSTRAPAPTASPAVSG